jgi:hypothetical protein
VCDIPECVFDPVIIDLSGAGFLMTSEANGVQFNFSGSGAVQLSWTEKGADVGWLALDRNGNGKIDDGAELFSNLSPQPAGAKGGKNGFRALAVYDEPANGGNGDGWITAKDAIFPKLLIWVDKNHDGVSQPGELFTLQQAAVKAISVTYKKSHWMDAYGNLFRYRGQITWEKPVNGQTSAVTYDVILVGPSTKGSK